MRTTMPDSAPALIQIISFYIVAALFHLFGLSRLKKMQQAMPQRSEVNIPASLQSGNDSPKSDVENTSPSEATKQQIQIVFRSCLLFTLVFGGVYAAIAESFPFLKPRISPTEQSISEVITGIVCPLLLGWIIIPIIERRLILFKPDQPLSKWERQVWQSLVFTKWILLLSPLLAIPFILLNAYDFRIAGLGMLGYYFVLAAFLRFASKSIVYFPNHRVQLSLAHGNYNEALRRAKQMETKFSADALLLYNKGTVLLFAGQYSEAEFFLRKSLDEAQKANRRFPEAYINLGYALLRQERYDEATEALQIGSQLAPKNGHAVGGLAEIYLYQGINAQQALEMITAFIKQVTPRRFPDRSLWGTLLGDEAWALALLGRHADAERSLQQAFEIMDKSFKPGLAGLHYLAGQTRCASNEFGEAMESFNQAIQLDTEGAYGQLSRKALQVLNTTENRPKTERH